MFGELKAEALFGSSVMLLNFSEFFFDCSLFFYDIFLIDFYQLCFALVKLSELTLTLGDYSFDSVFEYDTVLNLS
jgi:hypothetical protein